MDASEVDFDERVLRLHAPIQRQDLTLWGDEWSLVEEAIQKTFERGGSVKLTAAVELNAGGPPAPPNAMRAKDYQTEREYAEIATLSMDGRPHRFRLIVMDGTREVSGFRLWWDAGDFRGAERNQYDDVVDSRTLCTDVSVVVDLFREFYEHRGASERILARRARIMVSCRRAIYRKGRDPCR